MKSSQTDRLAQVVNPIELSCDAAASKKYIWRSLFGMLVDAPHRAA
jgi:hypothetical protein